MSSPSSITKVEAHCTMPPPPNLSKETLIVWEGWKKMGVVEVVRESAVKGNHIDLAYIFLSQRNQSPLDDTKLWFKNKVIEWVTELLCNKQVFRASHILKNIQLDPFIEIAHIMTNSLDSANRNFLASHLEKHGELDLELSSHLNLLNLMEKDIEALNDFKLYYFQQTANTASEVPLQILLDCDNQWKSKIAATLFLKYYDYSITTFITAQSLWDCVLQLNNKSFIKNWFTIQYSNSLEVSEDDQLLNLLLDLRVTPAMFNDLLKRSDTAEETKEFIYDTMAEYGDFHSDILNDAQSIVMRLSKNGLIDNLDEVFAKPTSALTQEQFHHILKEYCIQNKLFAILDACFGENIQMAPKHADVDHEMMENDIAVALLNSCRHVTLAFNNRHLLAMNLQQVRTFLQHVHSQSDQTEFHALLEIFLMQLNGFEIEKVIVNNKSLLEALPTVNVILQNMLRNPESEELSRYMLLNKHLQISINELLLPEIIEERLNFRSNDLVQKYGRCKKLDYTSYLLHCRPARALQLIDKQNLTQILIKVRRLAIKNFERRDICASCILFLERLKIDSEILKIEIAAIKYLFEKTDLASDQIQDMFLADKCTEILDIYEKALFEHNEKDFTTNLIEIEFLIKLAKNYDCPLPTMYLIQLARDAKWIEFLFIIHKFDYPHEVVCNLVDEFNDFVLFDHLSHALTHDLVYEPKNLMMRDRDARRFFLARIGLLKHSENDSLSSATSQLSWASNASSSASSDYFSDIEYSPERKYNLLQVLIRCHNSNDPPKALLHACQHYKYPLFAILATTYEPDSVVVCWLSWLSTSCNLKIENCERLVTISSQVTEFLRRVVDHGFYKTLRQSLCTFLNDNPLKIFMEFLCDCHNLNINLNQHEMDLSNFHKKMRQKRSNSYVPEMDHEMLYLENKIWIENTSITLLACLLNSFKNRPYMRVQLIQVLNELDIQHYFIKELPNFASLYRLFTYFYDHKINIDINFLKLLEESTYVEEIESCIMKMLNESKFEEGLRVSHALRNKTDLTDTILMRKWKEGPMNSEDYWNRCDREFRKYSISPKNAVEFYQSIEVDDDFVRHKILLLAYQWTMDNNLEEHSHIELQLWLLYLRLNALNVPIQIDAEKQRPYLDMRVELDLIKEFYEEELSSDEKLKLDVVIEQVLNAGSSFQGLRLKRLFPTYSNSNLDIIELCYSLAEGYTVPIQLTAQERLLLKKAKNNRSYSQRRKPLFSFRLSGSASKSPGSSYGTLLDVEPNVQDTLSLLESLIEGLDCGIEIGERILMTYRISLNTETSYNNILLYDEPLDLLLNALRSSCTNKIEVAHDFFCIYDWNKQQISDLLCEQLINAINLGIKGNLESYTMWDVNLDQEIHLILQLLPDCCSILGSKLYSYSSAIHKSLFLATGEANMADLRLIIELLVLSHACYTSDCNMEGISVVLKKSQTLINLLLTMKNWSLLVRLHTGIGRYNELNYVFHILRENDQFEHLLRKGNTKDNALRVALLDYLKKYCPDNRGLYEMVALYFSLYSEVAQIWETDSQQSIKNLIAISKLEMINRKVNPDECIFVELSNTEGTRMCLSKAMENYGHAAEYHLQGEKLAKAMNAARQAELIALQLSLVKSLPTNATTPCILNLTTSQISAILLILTFPQAIILSEAYNAQTDWAHAIFEHFILRNDHKYLDQYLITFNITDNLVYNLSRHYLSKNVTSETGVQNMKVILRLLPSVRTKYRIASELGYTDLVEELLHSDQLNYLKDTVWKQGYRE